MNKLKECAEIFSGFTYRTLPAAENDGLIALIQPKDIDSEMHRVKYDNALKVREFSGDHRHFLQRGDILVSGKGRTTPLVLFQEEWPKVVCTSALIIIRPLKTKCSPDYIAWYLQLAKAQKYFENNKTGTTILNLSLKTVQDLEIDLPGLKDQEKIGETHRMLLEQKAGQLILMEKQRRLFDSLMIEQIKR